MNLYFDTEFTGLHKDTTLISIGIISENNKVFYAQLNDYYKYQCDEWINNNVINNLLSTEEMQNKKCICKDITYFEGNKEDVAEELNKWILNNFPKQDIQFVSDVCHYDFVLLVDLFGNAFNLPKHVSASCHDINQDIARYYRITDKCAFDLNREEICMDLNIEIQYDELNKHNSLYDALIVKAISERINK